MRYARKHTRNSRRTHERRLLSLVLLTAAAFSHQPHQMPPSGLDAAARAADIKFLSPAATPSLYGAGTPEPRAGGFLRSKQDYRPCWSPWRNSFLSTGSTVGFVNMLRCAVNLWPVPGGLDKAISVVACESSFNPFAENEGHIGLFQHRQDFWLNRWLLWGQRLNTPPDPRNPWTNIIVSIRIVNRYGWSAWSCA